MKKTTISAISSHFKPFLRVLPSKKEVLYFYQFVLSVFFQGFVFQICILFLYLKINFNFEQIQNPHQSTPHSTSLRKGIEPLFGFRHRYRTSQSQIGYYEQALTTPSVVCDMAVLSSLKIDSVISITSTMSSGSEIESATRFTSFDATSIA